MNNFNYSNAGLDIESSVYLSGYLSSIYFEENFQRIDQSDSFIYIGGGSLSGDFDEYDFFKIIEKDIKKLKRLIVTLDYYDANEVRLYKDNESLINLINEYIESESYFTYNGLDEYETLLNKYDIEYEKNYISMVTKGYGQGDTAQILISKNEYKKEFKRAFKIDDNQEYFDNLFWDSPQSVCVEINGEEYVSEKFDGYYHNYKSENSYNKDTFIKEILEAFKESNLNLDLLKSELLELLPLELEYSD